MIMRSYANFQSVIEISFNLDQQPSISRTATKPPASLQAVTELLDN